MVSTVHRETIVSASSGLSTGNFIENFATGNEIQNFNFRSVIHINRQWSFNFSLIQSNLVVLLQ